jgi:hypothetical protein
LVRRLGVIALLWYDSDTWQTLHQTWSLPFGTIIGGCLMTAQISGGIGVQYPRSTHLASIVLGIVYLLFSLACIPGILTARTVYVRLGLGVCAISFALSQIFYLSATANLVPKWTESDFLGDTRDNRICTRGDCHSDQSPGTACDSPDDPHVGTLWCVGLGSAPDRSRRSPSELVRILLDFPHYRGHLDGG